MISEQEKTSIRCDSKAGFLSKATVCDPQNSFSLNPEAIEYFMKTVDISKKINLSIFINRRQRAKLIYHLKMLGFDNKIVIKNGVNCLYINKYKSETTHYCKPIMFDPEMLVV